MSDREERDLIEPERRHANVLRGRVRYLGELIAEAGPRSREKAEREALTVALRLFDLHFLEESAPEMRMSALLREAAQALGATGQFALAKRLTDRALLLEEQ